VAQKTRFDCLVLNSAGKIEDICCCNAKIERRDTEVPAFKSNGPAVPELYGGAWVRLHHGRIRCYPRRENSGSGVS